MTVRPIVVVRAPFCASQPFAPVRRVAKPIRTDWVALAHRGSRRRPVGRPRSAQWALGAEYFVLAVVVTSVALMLDRRVGKQSVSDFGRLLDAHNPTFITCSLLVVAAVILMLGQQDGLYLVVPTLIAVLIGGVVNAWLTLVRLPA
jgi:hypothetical protein